MARGGSARLKNLISASLQVHLHYGVNHCPVPQQSCERRTHLIPHRIILTLRKECSSWFMRWRREFRAAADRLGLHLPCRRSRRRAWLYQLRRSAERNKERGVVGAWTLWIQMFSLAVAAVFREYLHAAPPSIACGLGGEVIARKPVAFTSEESRSAQPGSRPPCCRTC